MSLSISLCHTINASLASHFIAGLFTSYFTWMLQALMSGEEPLF